MTDLSLAQHRSARCGFTSSAISTNYAALVIGRCGSIHSGFGSTIPQGSPRTRPQDEVERSLASMVKDGRGNATTEIKKVGTVKRYRFFRDHKDLQLP